ncbi:MAG: DUF2946 domain-containing protein [Xanthobacteraceae bacterium]
MRWIRSNRRGGALLALAGLVFQIFIALGHVHISANATGPVLKSAALADGARGDRAPSQHPDTSCDVCAVLHMASAAEISASPSPALPVGFVVIQRGIIVDRIIPSPRRILAQSRAPPAV